MRIPDVNVLMPAFHAGHADHARTLAWLTRTLESGEQIGLTPELMSGTIRLLTHRGVFQVPLPPQKAIDLMDRLREHPAVIPITAGTRHWRIFVELCETVGARGNDVADAAHAAYAIEQHATFVTLDRGFARFPGLRWELPDA